MNINQKYLELEEKIKEYNPGADFKLLKKAWEFAKEAHAGQKRLTGEDYILHPLTVSHLIADWRLDMTSVVAVLLHDTVEDTGVEMESITKNFGEDVALIVDGVTRITNLRLEGSRQDLFIENLRKMILTMAKDLRVVMVKLADRLHNLQTLYALPLDKQKSNAIETLEIYAPLAERLGMGEIKGELEDLSFSYAYPDEYKKLLTDSKIYFKKAEEHIEGMKKTLYKELVEKDVKAKINGRKKHLYSLWKKLQRPEIDWDYEKINDIVALRILVEKVSDCYASLGVVHNTYKPVPHLGVSDFIAQPKPNGYQSIHTKVFGLKGDIVEVQIRTYEMHEEAEMGLAAHWRYSEAKSKGVSGKVLETEGILTPKDKISWVKELVEWQNELTDSEEFIKVVKFDVFKHRNFVFSPKGDVYDLPVGATPVDFAYTVHTNLANYIKGAMVNGKIVPLDYKLKSGDIVEIIKTKNPQKPSPKWLDFAVTTIARKEIKKNV